MTLSLASSPSPPCVKVEGDVKDLIQCLQTVGDVVLGDMWSSLDHIIRLGGG